MRIFEYAVGDIHGRSDLLVRAIDSIHKHASAHGAVPRFVFLGDYVDRGADSKGVIDVLIKLQSAHDAICLLGNHEVMMFNAERSGDPRDRMHWFRNGGAATVKSYPDEVVSRHHLDWIASLPMFHETEHRFFVHAGVSPNKPLVGQSEAEYLWIRNPFLNHFAPFEKYVVHGHTILINGMPQVSFNRTNLDTGAYATDRLSVGVFDSAKGGKPFLCMVVTPDGDHRVHV